MADTLLELLKKMAGQTENSQSRETAESRDAEEHREHSARLETSEELELQTDREDGQIETGVITDLYTAPEKRTLSGQAALSLGTEHLSREQYMEHAREQVLSFFRGEGWHFHEVISRQDLVVWELGMSQERFTLRMRVAVEDDPRVCRIDAILPVSVDPVYDAVLCRELAKLNQPLRFGAFQYDENDGELSYRYSFPTGNAFFEDDLRTTFLAVMTTAARNFIRLQKLAVGKLSTDETESIREYVSRILQDLNIELS